MVTMSTMVTAQTMVTMTTMVKAPSMVTMKFNNAQIYYDVYQCDSYIFCFIVVLSSFWRN